MRIGTIDTQDKVLIVAEIGNNHEGRFDVAQKMVEAAAEARVDVVKFQTFKTELFGNPTDEARFKRLKSFELSYEQFAALAKLARSRGLLFMSTPLDLASADFLDTIVDGFKIASGDNNFFPLIDRVAKRRKPTIISTGLTDASRVARTVEHVRGLGFPMEKLALLHCVSAYPVEPKEANLRAIPAMARQFPVTIGYSDHTIGIEACLASVALGARIIEKHFTLANDFSDFRDHKLSADPATMRELVARVRTVEAMLGQEEKRLMPCEREGDVAYRRSVFVNRELQKGHTLTADDFVWLRPGSGIEPGGEQKLIGRRLAKPAKVGVPLAPDALE